ncbi:uncharacterized protein [Lolium perenne]|uniref:uncharacterized protein n=1 Tax=Lolium perenne TaxID=4522 RepID=UPI003A9902C2
MHKVQALADAMATAGSPLRDDEIIDYMLTGLGSAFNPIAASLNMITRVVTAAEFYSMVLNYEGLQLSQAAETEEWTSSANAAARGGAPWQPRAPSPAFSGGGSQPVYGGGNNGRPTYGGNGGGGYGPPAGGHAQPYGPPAGGNGGRPTGGNYGGNGGGGNRGQNGGRRRQRPQCQICGYWGHSADDCRNRFNPDFVRGSNQQRTGNNQQRAGNSASTSSPPWMMDTGATDHLTNDLQRLHMQERYGGTDQVQVANGAGQGHPENSASR